MLHGEVLLDEGLVELVLGLEEHVDVVTEILSSRNKRQHIEKDIEVPPSQRTPPPS